MKRKVIVRAPALSRSGYGCHSRFILRSLREYEHLFDIYLHNTNWGATGHITNNDLERRWIEKLIEDTHHYIQNGGKFDMSIQCTIPAEWDPRLAPINIGCTAGTETTKISPEWMKKCNEAVDKIITVSNHASYAFKNTSYQLRDQSGQMHGIARVQKPILHVNYPVREELCGKYNNEGPNPFKFETNFNFLVMAQWSPRKNLENTIRWWIEEFHDEKNCGLIVKTSIANDSRVDREYTEERLKQVLAKYPNRKCRIYLLHGTLQDSELVNLYTHESVKSLISLSHGEGFGLPAFEAALNDLPVITTDWGGETDFLYKKYNTGEKPKKLFVDVEYDIAQIQPQAVWNTVLQADSHWCFPKAGSFQKQSRSLYDDYGKYKKMAEELGEYVREEFKAKNQYKRFVEALGVKITASKEMIMEFD